MDPINATLVLGDCAKKHYTVKNQQKVDLKKIGSDTNTDIQIKELTNTVEIKGSFESIEEARKLIRRSSVLPIVIPIHFEKRHRLFEEYSHPLQTITQKYSVSITIETINILVEGKYENMSITMNCINLLFKIIGQIINLDIPPYTYIPIPSTKSEIFWDTDLRKRAKLIANITETKIEFPKSESGFTIIGPIKSITKAREMLLDNIPVDLIYEYERDSNPRNVTIEILRILGHIHSTEVSNNTLLPRKTVTIQMAQKKIPNGFDTIKDLIRWCAAANTWDRCIGNYRDDERFKESSRIWYYHMVMDRSSLCIDEAPIFLEIEKESIQISPNMSNSINFGLLDYIRIQSHMKRWEKYENTSIMMKPTILSAFVGPKNDETLEEEEDSSSNANCPSVTEIQLIHLIPFYAAVNTWD